MDSIEHSALISMASPRTACEAQLFTVQSWQVDKWWPQVVGHVRRWLDEDGTWTESGIKDELKEKRAQLWCLHDGEIKGIWVTRINHTDSVSIGLIWGCAGDFKEHKADALAFFAIIEDWLRLQGCNFIEIVGRNWSGLLSGYKQHAVILRKRL